MRQESHHKQISDDLLLEIENEEQEINRIKNQNEFIGKLQTSFRQKEKQINHLNDIAQKYQSYYEKYIDLKLELKEKSSLLSYREAENHILKKQLQQLLAEGQIQAKRYKQIQLERNNLIRERHNIERFTRQIQNTFKEYQTECKNREKDLLNEIQFHQEQLKQLRQKLDNYEINNFSNEEVKRKMQNIQNIKIKQDEISIENQEQYKKLLQQNNRFKQDIRQKQKQLQRSKLLNHDLSIQFDKSVSKICEFEKQLSEYRKQNHELKKTLNLVLEQEKYHKLHQKHLNQHQSIRQSFEKSEGSSESNPSIDNSSVSMSDVKF